MPEYVFLDTSFMIELFCTNSPRHPICKRTIDNLIANGETEFISSWFEFNHTSFLLSAHCGLAHWRCFIEFIRTIELITYNNETLHDESIDRYMVLCSEHAHISYANIRAAMMIQDDYEANSVVVAATDRYPFEVLGLSIIP